MEIFKPGSFFDLSTVKFGHILRRYDLVWEIIRDIKDICLEYANGKPNIVAEIGCFQKPLPDTIVIWQDRIYRHGFRILGGDPTKGTFKVAIDGEETFEASVIYAGAILWDEKIWIGKGVVIEPGALVKGPTVIGDGSEVRQGAYVRGRALIGERCVVGHTTEVKNAVFLDEAKAGHFAYVGDSILGKNVNLGAGTKLANLKMNRRMVTIRIEGEEIPTNLHKLGAVLGDGTETGCNSVTNPGVLIGPRGLVWPGVVVPSGYYPPDSSLTAY
ncbi:MAG: glucose-1-phosphate thymidylyltransferase [Thermodesulforhabdaceae bacterium]|jgi:bifunctional N-acetylglucosamine-1-phosphate-uridyltransferase/glucosamine-1-phosphate-acetyltransferase GlmU-like protein